MDSDESVIRRVASCQQSPQTSIDQAIRARGADYVLAVKDNRPTLSASIPESSAIFEAGPAAQTPHSASASLDKNLGPAGAAPPVRHRSLRLSGQARAKSGLRSFAVLESKRNVRGRTSLEQRYNLTSLPADS